MINAPIPIHYLPQLRWRSRYQLRLNKQGEVEYRYPHKWNTQQIQAIQHKHRRWLTARSTEQQEKQNKKKADEALTWCLLPPAWWRKAAHQLIPPLAQHWSQKMGVTYRSIRITGARTRWGSCTAQGVLSFSYHLIQTPWPLVEYVVVHELAHRKVFNHSPRFWAVVEKHLPHYHPLRAQLRQHAATLT